MRRLSSGRSGGQRRPELPRISSGTSISNDEIQVPNKIISL